MIRSYPPRWLPFGVILVFSLISFFLPASGLPSDIGPSDKLGHALIFVSLAVTGGVAGWSIRLLAAVLAAYAVTSEVGQWLLPIGRTGDWRDVIADLCGLGIGLGMVWLARSRRRH